MVRVTWIRRDGRFCTVRVQGHSGIAGQSLVCAAVSSAALMAANTVTEICGCRAVTRMRDGYLLVSVSTRDLDSCQAIFAGLHLHFSELQKQYPRQLQQDLLDA